ncbi:VOC family protein [Pseudomonas sp. JM0905a]|uniref:2,4,5-trihydroxytoluene oxygenase n=1 Tax=Metapseudomonas resinovorans TaxID=53412 RepID=A0ABT4YAY8_METRE|nr:MULTISPECIES: 2,4,5-trihydroxytoluene oxygenase [Pseudomonas]MBD2839781.1 VOC family protein [Pseudomonas sp. JM0905a]MDA8486050.1 2,4,5-trihydroxytoluene oxygenase [Pseudomonas resinovorans]
MLRIKDINHVIYQHKDLDAIEHFLTDFGLVVAHRTEHRIYLRGTGPLPYVYIAERAESSGLSVIAFAVESLDDLQTAARFPGASGIQPLEHPGGGYRVTLHDPSGRRIDLVHGIEAVGALPQRAALTLNSAEEKRRFGDVQRPGKGAAQVMRLGHVAIGVTDMVRMLRWYRSILGMLPSDLIVEGDDGNCPAAAFLRLNRGATWTDHHTIALFQAGKDVVHHASFEVQDFDAQCLGHQWMTEQGWRPFWGVGRHVLGSQIFDYWRDPSGNLIEHFTDGDLFNNASPMNHTQACDSSLYQWGPPMSVEYFLGGCSESETIAPRPDSLRKRTAQ